MSLQIDNNTFELKVTPSKRKREVLNEKHQSEHNNKENHFVYNNFMEIKSIADLIKPKINSSAASESNCAGNPYEVIRKPPKKKNRPDADDGGCVNPALNLNGPEKVINPFEVRRMPICEQPAQHCFENIGLNIRGEERIVANPFEIARDAGVVEEIRGIENPGLDIKPTLAIGVPFTPTVGCRIDFKNVPLEALTPCSMLSRQLVFSPIKKPTELTPKRPNLSIISEEAVDISKELDSYQLELENSMNEAKATKKRGNKNLMDIKRKNTFAKRLNEAIAIEPIKGTKNNEKIEKTTEAATTADEHSCHDSSDGDGDRECCPKSSTPKTPNENCIAKYPLDKSIGENPDVVYEEVDETSIEMQTVPQQMQSVAQISQTISDADDAEIFKNPAPFVRTYRRDAKKPQSTVVNNVAGVEQMKDSNDNEKTKDHQHHEMFSGLRSSIRKSIRKLIHPNADTKTKSSEDVSSSKEEPPLPHTASHNILTSIRHSLRRKQPKQPLATSTPCESLNDISIIDCKPRAVFKDATVAENVVTADGFDGENAAGGLMRNKSNIRSSFRKSSRQVMRSVFKKSVENYDLKK